MLDVGFSEIVVIFVLALVVLGPEKLPRVAAQVGRWIGRARGLARQFREQLEEEVTLEEARRSQPPPARSSETANSIMPPAATAPIAPQSVSQLPPVPHVEPEQVHYPDTYSHAHPTDTEGRPIEAPQPQGDSPQQDWVTGVTATEKPTQNAANTAYSSSNERGT